MIRKFVYERYRYIERVCTEELYITKEHASTDRMRGCVCIDCG